MKTLLVTGARGFTGQYVCKVFRDAGYQVVGLVRSEPKIDEVQCDLTDKESVNAIIAQVRPSGIIHLAALSFVGHTDQSAFYQVNIFAALNLLEALEKNNIQPDKLIFASSANIYGNPDIAIISEDVPPNPVNHYAASKLAMEFMVKNWFEQFPVLITRPFNYTGPGQSENFLIPKIVRHYRDHKTQIELGNLDVARDFSDVRDIAQAYLKLYESETHSEIVNLSSGKVYQLREVIAMMDAIAGYSIDVKVNPDFVRKNEIKVLCGSNFRLKTLTDYAPEYTFEQTLHNMYYQS